MKRQPQQPSQPTTVKGATPMSLSTWSSTVTCAAWTACHANALFFKIQTRQEHFMADANISVPLVCIRLDSLYDAPLSTISES